MRSIVAFTLQFHRYAKEPRGTSTLKVTCVPLCWPTIKIFLNCASFTAISRSTHITLKELITLKGPSLSSYGTRQIAARL